MYFGAALLEKAVKNYVEFVDLDLLRKAAKKSGMRYSTQADLEGLKRHISLKPLAGSLMIELEAEDKSAKGATRLANNISALLAARLLI